MPHGAHAFQNPEQRLDDLHSTVVLSAHFIHGHDPVLPGKPRHNFVYLSADVS
jgi:hypothetical protein